MTRDRAIVIITVTVGQYVNRESYALYRMVTFPMTLMDHNQVFKVTAFFAVEYQKKVARLKDEVTISQEKTIPNVWNGTMFGDLD